MNIWSDLKDFFFPRLCVVCGRRLLREEESVCVSCFSALPYIRQDKVTRDELERFFWGRFPIERVSSLFHYAKGGHVAHILYAMKYRHRKKVCRHMGELLASAMSPSGFFANVDVLLPVPLHKKRLRQRGYNQSECMAEGISFCTGIPVCSDALVRMRNNATQTHKSGYERWQSAEGLFQATVLAAALENKHIMLVDDVLTTGATLTACADALSGIKGIRISVVTLAWAK